MRYAHRSGSTPTTLTKDAADLARELSPWASTVFCSVADYVESGARGRRTKIPIPKPMVGSTAAIARFTHPLSPDRLAELGEEFRLNTHVFDLVPDMYCPRGHLHAVA